MLLTSAQPLLIRQLRCAVDFLVRTYMPLSVGVKETRYNGEPIEPGQILWLPHLPSHLLLCTAHSLAVHAHLSICPVYQRLTTTIMKPTMQVSQHLHNMCSAQISAPHRALTQYSLLVIPRTARSKGVLCSVLSRWRGSALARTRRA